MSEVKRYNAYAEGLTVHFELDSEGAWVTAEDFDAQRLRADTAEAELENEKARIPQYIADRASAEQKLSAAEQRIAELIALLQRVVDSSVLSFEADAPEDLESLEVDICAALNPNPEAESHE